MEIKINVPSRTIVPDVSTPARCMDEVKSAPHSSLPTAEMSEVRMSNPAAESSRGVGGGPAGFRGELAYVDEHRLELVVVDADGSSELALERPSLEEVIGNFAAVVDDREGLEGDDLGRFVDGRAVEASLALRTVGGWRDNVRFNAPTSHRGRRRAGVGGDSRRTLPASAP